ACRNIRRRVLTKPHAIGSNARIFLGFRNRRPSHAQYHNHRRRYRGKHPHADPGCSQSESAETPCHPSTVCPWTFSEGSSGAAQKPEDEENKEQQPNDTLLAKDE